MINLTDRERELAVEAQGPGIGICLALADLELFWEQHRENAPGVHELRLNIRIAAEGTVQDRLGAVQAIADWLGVTRTPPAESARAAVTPAMPAPTTTTSAVLCSRLSYISGAPTGTWSGLGSGRPVFHLSSPDSFVQETVRCVVRDILKGCAVWNLFGTVSPVRYRQSRRNGPPSCSFLSAPRAGLRNHQSSVAPAWIRHPPSALPTMALAPTALQRGTAPIECLGPLTTRSSNRD